VAIEGRPGAVVAAHDAERGVAGEVLQVSQRAPASRARVIAVWRKSVARSDLEIPAPRRGRSSPRHGGRGASAIPLGLHESGAAPRPCLRPQGGFRRATQSILSDTI
jgi:hypothetical protein